MANVLGFVATALIVLSLMMASLLWLRVVGMAGSALFTAYGLAIGAWPVVATNGAITAIHVVHLLRLYLRHRGDHELDPQPPEEPSRPDLEPARD